MKRILAVFTAACLLGMAGCAGERLPSSGSSGEPARLAELTVTVLDIGKADAILIRTGDKAMMIDTGEAEDAQDVLEALAGEGVRRLDYLIITHLDKDHVGGAGPLIRALPVGQIIQSHNMEESEAYADYQAACQEKGLSPIRLREVMDIEWEQARLRLLPAAEDAYTDDNDYSIMTELTYGGKRLLFAGDAVGNRLREYLDGEVQPVDFLKVPHHGRIDPMSAALLRAVKPAYAAITCSKKKPPDEELLTLLAADGTETFLTTDGAIRVITDGQTITVNQAPR